mmetsp:Transcript_120712/g.341360  ORF Transcript_120712/g.341360 Transcript_120712/m.341360 type:complete len:404 (+) Transcript_120712:80-1291(+)|eukprot:CAMPEP_0117460286 /NCGR_PEP_ID=MMETSP0784-20121206/1924_1 /TAXON_ID=39447 /ORGANISM="" /LENGTH=403 /DNA_ID=CAMNT_0005253943 /DNA_START=76 /DNA_END=1287 /DNA_ORIENTATION=+
MLLLAACLVSYQAPDYVSTGPRGGPSVGKPFLARRLPVVPHATSAVRCSIPRRSRRDDFVGVDRRSAAFFDEQRYAQQYFTKVLRDAAASLPEATLSLDIRLWLVLFACVSTYVSTTLSAIILAVSLGGAIAMDPWPLGVVYGLLGGALLRRVELWRRECGGERPEWFEESIWKQTCASKHDELLEKGVLLGMTPISLTGWLALRDMSIGEKSVSIVTEQCTDFQKALLQITGSLASCSLVHGLLQQVFLAQFASSVSISLAPVLALLAAAAFEFTIYLSVCEIFLPKANLEAQACQEAVSVERKRCARLFALMGASREVAGLRAEAFEMLAMQWEEEQQECRRRREITNFVRVFTAAAVYAASGGSILAPVLTNVAVTDSVFRAFSGESWSEIWRRRDDEGW